MSLKNLVKNAYYKDKNGILLLGDCINWMREMPDECIDLTVTSPPYANLRDYNGYGFNFENIAKELYRITKTGGVVVWIVGDKVEKGSETLAPFEQSLFFKKEVGLLQHDTMIYKKNAFPFPERNRYAQVFEYMFVLSKRKPKTAIIKKVPTKEHNRIKNKTSCYRTKSGETVPMKYETGKNTRNKENIWEYEVGYMKTTKDKFAYKHPATFPEKLAEDHILSWSNEVDIVFDPMVGAGTTCKMAKLNNRKFIGIDVSEEYLRDICIPRLKNLNI